MTKAQYNQSKFTQKFSEIITTTLSDKNKCYEPLPRKHAGKGIGYVRHRFPIKGGISVQDILKENIAQNNVLLATLKRHYK